MLGSSHSYHRALHCLADLRTSSEEMRDHWFLPYFITAALRISSSVFFHTPPFIMILILASFLRKGPEGPSHNQEERIDGGREERLSDARNLDPSSEQPAGVPIRTQRRRSEDPLQKHASSARTGMSSMPLRAEGTFISPRPVAFNAGTSPRMAGLTKETVPT